MRFMKINKLHDQSSRSAEQNANITRRVKACNVKRNLLCALVWFTSVVCFGQSIVPSEETCVVRADESTVCDRVFPAQRRTVYAAQPIRGSVMDIQWAGDDVVVVRAMNTLSGYRLNQRSARQYFQYELNADGAVRPSDISVSGNGRWLAIAEKSLIQIVDIRDGSLRFSRTFQWADTKKFVSAISFSDRFVGRNDDDKPNLTYAISNGAESWLFVSDIFNVVPPKGLSTCKDALCGVNGEKKRVDVDPLERHVPGVVGTIFPLRSFAFNDSGRAGFEGLLQASDCKAAWGVSGATGNPSKTLESTKSLLPCRRFAYPIGFYSLDFFAEKKFPNPFAEEGAFLPVRKGGKVLLAVGTSDKCEGILIEQVLVKRDKFELKTRECIKKEFTSRETTAVRFSKSGQYIAVGGADTEFTIVKYPGKSEIQIE